MLVYRVAHSEEYGFNTEMPAGPYNGNPYVDLSPITYRVSPDPNRDGIDLNGLDNKRDYFFGFSSLFQLTTWFGAAFDNLKKAGYVIWVYDVPNSDILFGSSQLCFTIDNAFEEGTLDLDGNRLT